jgi:glycosyltransferase involved in cell wall biosynthesis
LEIAIISQEFPPFFFGGVGSFCYNLAVNLAKKGINTTVLTGRSKKIVTERVNDCLEIVRLPLLDFPPRPLWFQLRNLKLVSKLLHNYDVIHIADPISSAAFAYVSKKLKKPVVTNVHSVPPIYTLKCLFNVPLNDLSIGDVLFETLEYPLRMSTIKFSLINSDHVVFGGLYALNKMKAFLNFDIEKASVIYNGISFDQIENDIASESAGSEKVPTILFVGRLFYFKGITHFIKALAVLKRSCPNFKAQVLGEGPLQGKMKKATLDLGLKDFVRFDGFINDRVALMKEIRNADVVAIPSLHEVGPSISLLEAMAQRKPVVAFDLPFSRELISNMENGVLANPNDIDDLADKLCLLCNDAHLRKKLGWNAYMYVKEKHNWSTLIDDYCKIYEMETKK